MYIVLLTALGVGGATVLGAVIGFLSGDACIRHDKTVMSFSAGIMLSASLFGLILPALESGHSHVLIIALSGIFVGAISMDLMDRLAHRIYPNDQNSTKAMLFVAAIAIHNFPEGIAAGVGFGTGNISDALLIAGGIALQNIPEGMVIIGPLLSTGIRRRTTFLIAAGTGLVEVIGTFLGYYTIIAAGALLPFMLCYAGGTMLFIICAEMIPDCCSQKSAAYFLLFGFCIMMTLSFLL